MSNEARREESEYERREADERRKRVEELDRFADERDAWRARNHAYYAALERLARFVVPEGQSVLEIGCGTGDLLAALKPARGVGIDLSPRLIAHAQKKHSELEFAVADAETLDSPALDGKTFDYVILSDVVGMLRDVWSALRALRRMCNPRTRVLVTYYNFVWEPLLRLGERLGQKMPVAQQNWLGMQDLENLLQLNHFEIVRSGTAQLAPVDAPLVAPIANRYLAQLPGLRHLALTQFFVAKLAGGGGPIHAREYTCSVIVPCKNERGNIDDIVARTPELGRGTELIFVDGNSDDGTVAAIERHLRAGTRPRMKLVHQGDGRGKGDAVRKGFAAASGDVLFILDADLTVPPEELPKFYAAIAEGRGEFVNGSRLVYPMEGEAMRFLNSVGNKAFGLALSAILEQRLKDTLCGTKVLFRRDYERIARARGFFGDFDPFGDFDLLFGAAKQNLKIVELPVRYRARTYGETKISRFRHGAILARMTAHAFRKFKTAY
ncbi:MAG TPA: bifunctional class I SAM-dependent methyltransferase/glycosyltransferase family 2 protein [Polyangia bacterium]|nr:bifunctional class I SAM-dependent methyltransferase/glycosyltransferase family 2 protein [Polyangia bacterium]